MNFKVHIRQRKKNFGCFDIDSLQKITVGSKRDETSLSSDSGNVSDLKLLDCLIELVEVVYSEPTPPVVSRKSRSAVKKNRIMKLYIVNDMIGQLYGHVILTM